MGRWLSLPRKLQCFGASKQCKQPCQEVLFQKAIVFSAHVGTIDKITGQSQKRQRTFLETPNWEFNMIQFSLTKFHFDCLLNPMPNVQKAEYFYKI